MDKIIKINSNQGGSFSANNNLVDFDIPADGVYDLSKSYVNLMCSVSEAPTNDRNGVAMPVIKLKNDDGTRQDNRFSNIALVKNMNMKCSNRGQIADIRRVDVLRNNLNEYMLSTQERESKNISSLVQGFNRNQQVNSIFREIRKEGDSFSKAVSSPVRIPLSQLCNFGKTTAYDTTKYGKTRLHLELNLDKVDVSQYLGAAAGNNWSRGDDKNVTLQLGAGQNPNMDSFTLSRNFRNLEDSPIWVGQVLKLNVVVGGGRGGGGYNVFRRVDSINWDRGTGAVSVVVDEAFQNGQGALTGGETADITIEGDTCVFTFNCDYGELVLQKLGGSPKVADQITYTEFSTEEHNANGVQNFQRQFQVEPECINLLVMKNEDIISKRGDLSEWRLRLNNEDLTDRPVKYHSPLSLDRLNMTLGNSNNVLHNANERNQRILNNQIGEQIVPSYQQAANELLLICNPLPQTPNEKMVQVNINCATASLNKMCLFKECIRVI